MVIREVNNNAKTEAWSPFFYKPGGHQLDWGLNHAILCNVEAANHIISSKKVVAMINSSYLSVSFILGYEEKEFIWHAENTTIRLNY